MDAGSTESEIRKRTRAWLEVKQARQGRHVFLRFQTQQARAVKNARMITQGNIGEALIWTNRNLWCPWCPGNPEESQQRRRFWMWNDCMSSRKNGTNALTQTKEMRGAANHKIISMSSHLGDLRHGGGGWLCLLIYGDDRYVFIEIPVISYLFSARKFSLYGMQYRF